MASMPSRPMDIISAREDATGAALKAIQAVENAAVGRAAHPRSGDLSFPQFRKEGCTQCKRCTVECPFGAINEEDGYPQFNASRCRRCGTCMGACPVRVISFENYSVDTVGQQLKNIDIPDEFDEKPRGLPITHIMHGLAHYAHRLGLAPEKQPTRKFAKLFWDNIIKNGRANELKMGLSLYFKDGFGSGIKEAMKNKALGQAMMKTKRMNPMEFFGGHGVKDKSGLHAMLAKAREIEDAKFEHGK